MGSIEKITKLTNKHYVNLFETKGKNHKNEDIEYLIAARTENIEDLKAVTHKNDPDSVIIYALCGENRDKVVLIRQYRFTINDYVYELPAGLVDAGETYREAAVREMKEETGMNLEIIDADPIYELPRFTTIGMTDESSATVYGYASGETTNIYAEAAEEIEVILADRDMVRKILKEELVVQQCAYHMIHFLSDADPFAFLK